MAPLADQFVWVRVIKANDLDLALFQFDYELTFAITFMNADKTVYGRYGSRSSRENAESDVSIAGLAESMRAVLSLHAGYPANKATLAGKQAKPSPFKTPLDIPRIRGKYKSDLNYGGKVAQSCVHCHQVTEALRYQARRSTEPMPLQLIFPYPAPSTVGFTLDPKQRGTVATVEANSPAASALLPGDELMTVAGQAIVSQADVQWVLHHAQANETLPVELRRDGKLIQGMIRLSDRWRFNSDVGWRTGGWEMRRMALGGLKLVAATAAQRRANDLEDHQMALVVDYVGQWVEFGTAKKVGFQKGDIIVQYGPKADNISESQLLGWSVLNARPGQKLPVTLLRDGKRMTLRMPMQE